MKLWIDDVRPAPAGYTECKTVRLAKEFCMQHLFPGGKMIISEINLDHDAGDMAVHGGDYIELLNWLEEKQNTAGWKIFTVFRIHSMNPVGKQNMEKIIKKNGWTYRCN